MKLGQAIRHQKAEYEVTGFMSLENYKNTAKKLKETGKYIGQFSAAKVLKNGNLSENQTICFLAFLNSDRIVVL